MRVFFSGLFMKKETLNEVGINHPIKLEYYKIINNDETFGVNVVKTEYKKDTIEVENKNIDYVSDNEKRVEEFLNLLKENEVTPVIVEDVLSDFPPNLQ